MNLKLAYFYPKLMNLYGDYGNVITLQRRCQWRGIDLEVIEAGIGDSPNMADCDLAFFGGGQDKEQLKIGEDLIRTKAENIRAAVENGLVFLAICGGLQLLGQYYQPIQGPALQGIALLDLWTIGGTRRAIGDVIVRAELEPGSSVTMVGFENHSGQTYLGPGCRTFGKVITGSGNNGFDRSEGARYRNCFGTYLHGPLLPKNPAVADCLISLALGNKYGKADLQPLDDSLENQTREYMVNRVRKQKDRGYFNEIA
jgi:lipid II isoglutaminyl synthase (glutamine-hydrolysing)